MWHRIAPRAGAPRSCHGDLTQTAWAVSSKEAALGVLRTLQIHEPLATGAALGAKARPATRLAGLFVEFANSHFFLDAAPLHELSKAADGLLGRLLFAKCQLNQRI